MCMHAHDDIMLRDFRPAMYIKLPFGLIPRAAGNANASGPSGFTNREVVPVRRLTRRRAWLYVSVFWCVCVYLCWYFNTPACIQALVCLSMYVHVCPFEMCIMQMFPKKPFLCLYIHDSSVCVYTSMIHLYVCVYI